LGQGSNGAGGNCVTPLGQGGSGGAAGSYCSYYRYYSGGLYGGGASIDNSAPTYTAQTNIGGKGAVRIVWPGCARTFPSTCVGSP
jgi:hypothetical protein